MAEHHDPRATDQLIAFGRTYVAVDALRTDGITEAAADALATRLVDPEFGPTHFQIKMRERERARTAIDAALMAVIRATVSSPEARS